MSELKSYLLLVALGTNLFFKHNYYKKNNKKKSFTKRMIFSIILKYNNFLELIYITTSMKVIIDQVILMIVVL